MVCEISARTNAQGRLQIAFQSGTPGRDEAGLGEDYVTTLADDGAGHLLIGHRQTPPEALDLKTGASQALGPSAYVGALLPLSPSIALAGSYGDGPEFLAARSLKAPAAPDAAPQKPTLAIAALPVAPAPPTLAQINALLAEADRVKPDPHELQPHAAALADDWRTEGDWLGRYGRYWMQWRYTDNPRVLEMPAAYTHSRVLRRYTTWGKTGAKPK